MNTDLIFAGQFLLLFLRVPVAVALTLSSIAAACFLNILMLNVIMLVLGMICDMGPVILIATPILLPVAEAVGVNPIHFGIIMMLNLGIGLTTPPVGAALFAVCSIGKVEMGRAVRAVLPMHVVMLAVLIVVNLVPELTLFLPAAIMGS